MSEDDGITWRPAGRPPATDCSHCGAKLPVPRPIVVIDADGRSAAFCEQCRTLWLAKQR